MEEKHCKWYNDEFCTNDKSPCVADYCPVVEYPDLCKHRETEVDKDINVRSKTEIEEMAQCKNSFGITCNECCTKACERYALAEELYNAGYCKSPENAVVLTREEYERLLKEETLCERLGNDIDVKLKYIYELEDKVAQERKETAEKFAEMVSKAFIGLNCIDIDEWNWCQRKIDEICKEISEGERQNCV